MLVNKITSFYNKPLVRVLTIIAIAIVSTYGVDTLRDMSMYKKIGWFIIRPYKYGIYLTQQDSGIFYNFSPYDSFIQKQDGTVSYLLPESSKLYSRESELIKYSIAKPIEALYSIKSYFNILDPQATFKTRNGHIVLRAITINSNIRFLLQKDTVDKTMIPGSDQLFLTLSYNDGDFIVDENGTCISNTKQSNIDEINNFLNEDFIKSSNPENLRDIKLVKKLLIFNKHMSGVLGVNNTSDAFSIEKIDEEKKIIYFRVKDPGKDSKPYIDVEVFDSIKDAVNSL